MNSATVTADGPEGPLSDDSQNGSDPDPNNDNDPTNNDEDTPVSFQFDPGIGLAKRLASIEMVTDDCELFRHQPVHRALEPIVD